MVGRSLTGGMVTGLEAKVIRPVLIARFDIVTDPLIAWTGPGTFAPDMSGDPKLDGQVFVNLAPLLELSDVTEDQGIGGPTGITVTGHDLDEDLLQQIVKDKRQWRGQPAWLWMGLMNSDEATVIADPTRIKTGVMTQMIVKRDAAGATVTVTIDRDLGRARSAPFRWIDHTRLFSLDLWSTFIIDLANQPGGFTVTPLSGFYGGGRRTPGAPIRLP